MEELAKILSPHFEAMYELAKSRHGSALRALWLNEVPGCPGCGRDIGTFRRRGRDALSLNGFFYRPAGVLIGYLLCGECAGKIQRAGLRGLFSPLPLHKTIEQRLIENYTTCRSRPEA